MPCICNLLTHSAINQWRKKEYMCLISRTENKNLQSLTSMLVFSPPRYTLPFNSSINVLFYAKSTSCVKNCLVPCDHICCCCHVLRCDCSARRGNGLLATGSGPALISTLCRILGIFFFLKSWNIH